jgi:L-ascorbate metabolism protein UlaG (beta-lactamase superfamily)
MTVETIAGKMHWLGHDAIRIDAGLTIYFDPFQIESGPVADIIFISHDHYDHLSPEDLAKIQGPDTTIVTAQSCRDKVQGTIKVVAPGDSLVVKDIPVQVVASYNINKKFHPKENRWVGFIVEIDGVRIYHAGDTDMIEEMHDINTDIALLPVSGTYVMTAEEAVEAALVIKPALAIPMHYGVIVGDASDADRFKKLLEGKIPVKILKKE